jgi:hypothetical protein
VRKDSRGCASRMEAVVGASIQTAAREHRVEAKGACSKGAPGAPRAARLSAKAMAVGGMWGCARRAFTEGLASVWRMAGASVALPQGAQRARAVDLITASSTVATSVAGSMGATRACRGAWACARPMAVGSDVHGARGARSLRGGAHYTTLMAASMQDHDPVHGRSAVGRPGFFSGITSASSAAGSNVDHGAWSESSGDMQSSAGRLLIPRQVLVPGSMKSACFFVRPRWQQSGGRREPALGARRARAKGGGLMSMLGGNLGGDPAGSKA